MEKNFYEDIKDGNLLRDEAYLWLYCIWYGSNSRHGFETGIFFWDNDIYQQVEKIVPKIKSLEEA